MNYRKILLATMLAIASSAQAQEGAVTRNTDSAPKKSTTHTISFDVGPSWITSKVYTPSGTYKWKTGFELGVEYNCVFKKGYGFGFSFLHNTTNYPDVKATQIFVGPSFVYAGDFSRKWRGVTEIGLGYSTFFDEHDTEVGLGVKYSVGLEYKLSDKFGISAKLRDITVYFGNNEDDYGWNRNKNEINGVVRLALLFGACFHF